MDNVSKVLMPDKHSPLVRAIAYYRSSTQGRQDNSIEFQRANVVRWAVEHGVEIVREFCDVGHSGANVDDRQAFKEMMEDCIKQRSDFEFILCLDESRWGRFSGSDLLAGASEICRKRNKQLIYTSVGVPRD